MSDVFEDTFKGCAYLIAAVIVLAALLPACQVAVTLYEKHAREKARAEAVKRNAGKAATQVAEPAMAPERWAAYGLAGLYTVVGLGLRGGWKQWRPAGRMLYAALFPLHVVVLFVLARMRADRRWWLVPLVAAVGTAATVLTGMGKGNEDVVAFVALVALVALVIVVRLGPGGRR
jgi:predicted ferric reductase